MREITIVFDATDAFRGTLRCKTATPPSSGDALPQLLKSESMIPVEEASKKGSLVMPISLERDSRKKATSELDLVTINVMLTSLKSGLLLADPLEPNHKYFLQPSPSSNVACLYRLTSNAGPFQSRLANAMRLEVEKKVSLAQVIENGSRRPKRKLEIKATAWMDVLQNGSSVTMELVQESMEKCVNEGTPTPQHVMTHLIPTLVLGQTSSSCKRMLTDIVTTFWMTETAMQGRVRAGESDSAKVLRTIQLQALLRLQLLAMGGETFLKVYSRKVRNKKERFADPQASLITEVTTVLSHASFVLDAKTPLGSFLEEMIPESIYCSIPEAIQEIFDFFESPNPFANDEDETLATSVDVLISPSPKKKPRRPSLSTPGTPKSKNRVSFAEHVLSSTRPMDLTSQRSNPLVKDMKPSFVGSHFNTKLANIMAHYREVQMNLPPPMSAEKVKTHSPENVLRQEVNSMLQQCHEERCSMPPPPSGEKPDMAVDTPSKNSVSRSPFAGQGRKITFDMETVGSSPDYTEFGTPGSVLDTPVRSGASMEEDSPEVLPLDTSRKPFSISRPNMKQDILLKKSSNSSAMQKSNARALAQEALAAARGFR